MDDYAFITLRFLLYLDLIIIFGLPFFIWYSLKGRIDSFITKSNSYLIFISLNVVAILLSIIYFIMLCGNMMGAEGWLDIETDIMLMVLNETELGISLIIRMAAFLSIFIFLFIIEREQVPQGYISG
ncbi:hypothetical protein [Providencia rettgeri]|uniref:hypothetical protein n=1 Tax=Providencia rettgeri TaxID=587 RepID=UPI0034E0D18C